MGRGQRQSLAFGDRAQPGPGRYLLTNAFIVFVGLLANQLIGTGGAAVLTRIVASPAEYGEINVLLQILGLVGIFLSLGLNSSLTHVIATGRTDHRDAYWIALATGSAFGAGLAALLALSAGLLAHLYHLPMLAPAIMVMALVLIVNSATNVLMAVLAGHKLFRRQSVGLVIPVFFSNAGMVTAIALAPAGRHVLVYAALGQVLGALIGLAGLARLARNHLPPLVRPIAWGELKPLLAYGFPMWAGNIAKSFQQPFLIIMLGIVSLSDAGFLSNGLKLGGFLNNVTWAFNIVVLPWLSEVKDRPVLAGQRATLAFRYNNYLVLTVAAFLILASHPLATAIFGARFAATGRYLVPVALAIACSSVSRLGGTLLAGIGKPRGNFWPMVAAGAMTLGGVPVVLFQAGPSAALWPYVGGWILATALTVLFMVKDGLLIVWSDAFGRPAVTLMAMLVVFWGTRIAGLAMPAQLALTLAAAAASTWMIERGRRWAPSVTFRHGPSAGA